MFGFTTNFAREMSFLCCYRRGHVANGASGVLHLSQGKRWLARSARCLSRYCCLLLVTITPNHPGPSASLSEKGTLSCCCLVLKVTADELRLEGLHPPAVMFCDHRMVLLLDLHKQVCAIFCHSVAGQISSDICNPKEHRTVKAVNLLEAVTSVLLWTLTRNMYSERHRPVHWQC